MIHHKVILTTVVVAALLSAAAAGVSPITSQEPLSVNPGTQRLQDGLGREVVYHGVNVVVKAFPWIPVTDHFDPKLSFAEKDMATLQELGLNGIRLGTMWPGAEPVRGQYNETYLQAIHDLVANASRYEIHALLDMHQDVLSEKFCGEGAPDWAVQPVNDDFPAPVHPSYAKSNITGYPTPEDCAKASWSSYYFTPQTGSAFQAIYSNKDGLRDSFAGFWKKVATTMKDLGAAVLGYELMNEPWAGDAFKDLLLMVPGVADKVNLQPTWDAAAAAIRQVDTAHAVFFEGVTWDWLNVGFTAVPGGDTWRNKSVLSYHFYVPPDFDLDVQMDARIADMKRLQCGGFLSEFGDYGDLEVPVMDKMDSMMQSWLTWEYKPFIHPRTGYAMSVWFPNGTMNLPAASRLSRTYAKAVAGRTDFMRYNTSSHIFTLQYRTAPGEVRSTETRIYYNAAMHYPKGVAVSVSSTAGPKTVTYSLTEHNHVTVTHQELSSAYTILVELYPL